MKALLIIDVQNDFVPGGSLAVAEGDQIVPFINQLMEQQWDLIVATKDWHPRNHCSFASNHSGRSVGEVVTVDGIEQILWPDHCIQDSNGAQFVGALNIDRIDKVIYKGTDPAVDSYSAFYDNGGERSTGLTAYLREKGIEELFVVGLATDYCGLFSVLDACREGFRTTVLLEGCRGVEVNQGDVERAVSNMRECGAEVVERSLEMDDRA